MKITTEFALNMTEAIQKFLRELWKKVGIELRRN